MRRDKNHKRNLILHPLHSSPVKPDKKDYKVELTVHSQDMMTVRQEDKKDEKREKIPMVPDQSMVKPVTPKW